uniref:Uncharacterized protein n=2 Tax=Caenorhabditis japonica TaxID=281687 RepID=A0A8R1E618_CAEJA
MFVSAVTSTPINSSARRITYGIKTTNMKRYKFSHHVECSNPRRPFCSAFCAMRRKVAAWIRVIGNLIAAHRKVVDRLIDAAVKRNPALCEKNNLKKDILRQYK